MKRKLFTVLSLTLLAMLIGVGVNAQNADIQVSTNRALEKALTDNSIKSIEITKAGYYNAIGKDVAPGYFIFEGNSMSRDEKCRYFIQTGSTCFSPNDQAGTAMVVTIKAGVVPLVGASAGECPEVNTGWWTCTSKPTGAKTPEFINAQNNDNVQVKIFVPGKYEFKNTWYVDTDNHAGQEYGSAQGTFFYYASPVLTMKAKAGCETAKIEIKLTNNQPDNSLLPTIPASWVEWSIQTPGSNGFTAIDPMVTIADALAGKSFNYNLSPNSSCGKYTLKVKVQNQIEYPTTPGTSASIEKICVTEETVDFYIYDKPIRVSADYTKIECDLTAKLSGSYHVSCNNEEEVTTVWTKISGPVGGTATFTSPNADTTGVKVNKCGTYTFKYTVNNGPCTVSDTVQVQMIKAIVLNKIEDATLCLERPTPTSNSTSYTLNIQLPTSADCGYTAIPELKHINATQGQDNPTITEIKTDLGIITGYEISATKCGDYIFQYILEQITDQETVCISESNEFTISFIGTPKANVESLYVCDDKKFRVTVGYDLSCPSKVTTVLASDNINVESIVLIEDETQAVNVETYEITVTECGEYTFNYSVHNTKGNVVCATAAEFNARVITKPELTIPKGLIVCGDATTIKPSYTVECDNEVSFTPKLTPVSDGNELDPITPNNDGTYSITARTCGEYKFAYEVAVFFKDGSYLQPEVCKSVDTITINFIDKPELTVTNDTIVCGYTAGINASYEVECELEESNPILTTLTVVGSATGVTITPLENNNHSHNIEVKECGTYTFKYTANFDGVEDCGAEEIFVITFVETPELSIDGKDNVRVCETAKYEVLNSACATIDKEISTVEYTWLVSGGTFANGLTTATGTEVTVTWDNQQMAQNSLSVKGAWTGVANCEGEATSNIKKTLPNISGQVKYWNNVETYMPTPYKTIDYATYPEDYFYVSVYKFTPDGYAPLAENIKVEPRLNEDLQELMSHFSVEVKPSDFNNDNCELALQLEIFDGGLVYHGDNVPEVAPTHLGANYTYKNWGGVNATDALIINLMAANEQVNEAPLSLTWIHNNDNAPVAYGFFSHAAADVNNSKPWENGGLTGLDAMTTNYRHTGRIKSFPDMSSNHQFNGNYRVAGRMVSNLPEITWPAPFSVENDDDVVFKKKNEADYLYFSNPKDHAYVTEYNWNTAKPYINIYYLANGDLNSSYVPEDGMKKAENRNLFAVESVINTNIGDEITIPVTFNNDITAGAISLQMEYNNSLIEVLGTNFDADYYNIDQENGILTIGWFNVNGKDIANGDVIAEITVKVLADISANTTLIALTEGEVADVNATVVTNAKFSAPAITTEKVVNSNIEMLTASNYPNPFNGQTTITYTLPEQGNVRITVRNNQGVVIAELINATQVAGSHSIPFNQKVSSGIYFYEITVEGETNNFRTVQKMIVK